MGKNSKCWPVLISTFKKLSNEVHWVVVGSNIKCPELFTCKIAQMLNLVCCNISGPEYRNISQFTFLKTGNDADHFKKASFLGQKVFDPSA